MITKKVINNERLRKASDEIVINRQSKEKKQNEGYTGQCIYNISVKIMFPRTQ